MTDPKDAIWEFVAIYAFVISAALVAYQIIK